MEIKTKRSIGDTVYVVNNNVIEQRKIEIICLQVDYNINVSNERTITSTVTYICSNKKVDMKKYTYTIEGGVEHNNPKDISEILFDSVKAVSDYMTSHVL